MTDYDVVEEARKWQRTYGYISTNHTWAEARACDRMDDLIVEITKLRAALQYCATQVSNGYDIDGGYFQDEMIARGLMVEVPADEAFKAEYDSDVMYVLAWSELAKEGS